MALLSSKFQLSLEVSHYGPATPPDKSEGLGSSQFARHYYGNLC